MFLHYSEKSVHWPEIRTSEVRGTINNNIGKKLNCTAMLVSFNMPHQGFTKYI